LIWDIRVTSDGESMGNTSEDLELVLGFLLDEDVFCSSTLVNGEGVVNFWKCIHEEGNIICGCPTFVPAQERKIGSGEGKKNCSSSLKFPGN
jgi:hypothetical protein